MNKKGITMIALVITILIMIILGSAAVGTVIGITKLARKDGYETTSRLLREQVDTIYKEIIAKKENTQTFNEVFNDLYVPNPFSLPAVIPTGLIPDESYNVVATRYGMQASEVKALLFYSVNTNETKKILNIENSDFDFYINFEKNIVFSMAPFKLDDTTNVYTLEEIDSTFKAYGKSVDISAIQVGDIIYYDPTKDVTDSSKLTYTSPKGSSRAAGDEVNASGNGYANRTFQATSNDNKWVVLYIENGQISLMSENVKNSISGNFIMENTTAYLYAEQEIHNICSIYGHR